MADREEVRDEARGNRGLAGVILGLAALVGVIFVAFLIYYTFIAPERVAAPTESLDAETPSEGVGVPDGGELTNEPTQAAPDSPSRTLGETQEP
ncbi:hypothetical protein NO932_15845 [Pelagibacterium sp. 26DY04]|uniref:hypothetical protein n=1 Tax=Pelagibacterium sp. 26DY04 TaxID=2967130 RepID=UPI0028168102|nr:hypothetical protein [Pelagibacterium sp. 26DY04]WMT86372.1 hypothetical protein NO932_15845 [Pelagibacterium sp. 26DY04]